MADALGDLAEREPELVEQDGVRPRFLDRRQLLARHVLDQAEEQRLAVVRLADERGHGRGSRLLGRAPAALAGDQLVTPRRARADEHRLDDSLHADRVGERRGGFGVEASPRLPRVRVDLLDRQVRELGLVRAADQDLEAAAETAAFSCGPVGHDEGWPPHEKQARVGRRECS